MKSKDFKHAADIFLNAEEPTAAEPAAEKKKAAPVKKAATKKQEPATEKKPAAEKEPAPVVSVPAGYVLTREPKTTRAQFLIRKSTAAALAAEAKRQKTSKNEIVNRAIEIYLKEVKKDA